MSKPKLTYFDAPVSRGEECRIALAVAGVDYEDVRLSREAWLAMKPSAPFGTVPFWEEPRQPALGQSNAILTLIGRRHDLHPKDEHTAAQHEALMEHVEDMRHEVGPVLRITDPVEKKQKREAIASGFLQTWATYAEKHLGNGPFVAGEHLHVVDIKLYMALRWFKRGTVDHIPATVFDKFPKLTRLHDAVAEHAKVRAWLSKN